MTFECPNCRLSFTDEEQRAWPQWPPSDDYCFACTVGVGPCDVDDHLAKLLARLRPTSRTDDVSWEHTRAKLSQGSRSIFWSASSGTDLSPICWNEERLRRGPQRSPEDKQLGTHFVHNTLYVFSDYGRDAMGLYLDPWVVDIEAKYVFGQILHLPPGWRASVLERVPLRAFGRQRVRALRANYPGFRASMTKPAIPLDDTHAVWLKMLLEKGNEERVVEVLFFALENLLLWNELLARYKAGVEIFCALRVQGKSGSWDHLHSSSGALFRAIAAARPHLRPRVWVGDVFEDLPPSWKIVQGDGHTYGVPSYALCDWPGR